MRMNLKVESHAKLCPFRCDVIGAKQGRYGEMAAPTAERGKIARLLH